VWRVKLGSITSGGVEYWETPPCQAEITLRIRMPRLTCVWISSGHTRQWVFQGYGIILDLSKLMYLYGRSLCLEE